MSNVTHTPVLLDKAVNELRIIPDKYYVDATFGGGGHTRKMLDAGAKVVAIDTDEWAINHAPEEIVNSPNCILVHENFQNIATILKAQNIDVISGALFDLGTSAYQLENPGRGFSFLHDEPLDMRMNQNLAVTAKDLVNALSVKELTTLIKRFSGERRPKAVASAIVDYRKENTLETTSQLAQLIAEDVYKGNRGKLHPATHTFQALRIAVNDELNAFEAALTDIVPFLEAEARIVVISFHDGEDRIAKHTFNNLEDKGLVIHHTKKPITPSTKEVQENPRSRSAKLRIAEKLV